MNLPLALWLFVFTSQVLAVTDKNTFAITSASSPLISKVVYSGISQAAADLNIKVLLPWQFKGQPPQQTIQLYSNDKAPQKLESWSYELGSGLGNSLIKAFPPKDQDKILLWSKPRQYQDSVWHQGIKDILEKQGIRHQTLLATYHTYRNPMIAKRALNAALKAQPQIKYLIIEHGPFMGAAISLLKEKGHQPGEFILAGLGYNQGTADAIHLGWVQQVVDLAPYLRGYIPTLNAYLSHSNKDPTIRPLLEVSPHLISNHNLSQIRDLKKNGLY